MASNPTGSTPRTPSAWANATSSNLHRLGAFEPNPQVDAIVRKMVPDVATGSETSHRTARGPVNVPDPAYLRQVSSTVAQDTTDATSLMQILPDLELVKNLLISGILAPKDLVSSEVNFSVDRRAFDLPIAGRMLDVIVDHFTNIYSIKDLCPTILEDTLFFTGSYPILVIPENAVDSLINGKTSYSPESFQSCKEELFDHKNQVRSLGFLGKGYVANPTPSRAPASVQSFGIESFAVGPTTRVDYDPHPRTLPTEMQQTVLVCDNFNIAKVGPLLEAKRQYEINSKLYGAGAFGVKSPSLEAQGDYELGGVQRRRTFGAAAMVQAIRTKDMLSTPTVGHPLIMHLPSEAVIPVFLRPGKNLGYFILLDIEGNPISLANRKDIYNDLVNQGAGNSAASQATSQMIQMAQNLSLGITQAQANDYQQMARIYGQLLEHDLRQRLASGTYNKSVQVEGTDEIYQVMLARTMKRMQTQLLYVPAELMTYFAFDYAENGTGRSLTEKGKIIGSIRAMLTFANVMGGIKNSVSRQRVTLQLSENDPDPAKTLARSMDEFTRRRNVVMPFVAGDPNSMFTYLNLAGVEWNVEGKGAPAHKVDVEDKVSNRAKVDVDLNNEMRDRHYMNYGVTPETVIASQGPEFATTALINNQMMAKRVISMQDKFTPQLEDHVQKVTRNSAVLLNDLREIVVQALKEEAIQKEGEQETQSKDVVDGASTAPGQVLTNVSAAAVQPTAPAPVTPPAVVVSEEQMLAVERIVHQFVDAIRVALPRPDTATIKSQTEAFDAYAEAVDKKLSMMIDAAFLTNGSLGQYAGKIEEIKAAYKAYFLRQWMANNGYLPELDQITALDNQGQPELDLGKETGDFAETVAKGITGYLTRLGPVVTGVAADVKALDKKFPDAHLADGAETTAGGGFGGGSTDTGFGGGDDFGGTGGATEEPAAAADGGDLNFDAGLSDSTGPAEPGEPAGGTDEEAAPEPTPAEAPAATEPATPAETINEAGPAKKDEDEDEEDGQDQTTPSV